MERDLPGSDARRWLVVSALVPPRGEELLMVDALRRVGARAVAREGERVLAWLAPPPDVEARVREVEGALRASTSMTAPGLAWRWESQEAWAARWGDGPGARRVGERILVAPVGVQVERRPGDVVVRLDRGTAFGTAEHATTRGCLRLLEAVVRPRDRVADIGTGSGILAIAAALLGAGGVHALEADPLACADARRNVAASGVADRVEVREATVGPADLRALRRPHLILANLEAGILGSLLPAVPGALAPGGALIVGGVSGGERAALLAAAAAAGLEPHRQDDGEGWWCGLLRPLNRRP